MDVPPPSEVGTSFTDRELEHLHKLFQSCDADGDGRVSLDEVSASVGLEGVDTSLLQEAFFLYDAEDGRVDFDHFVNCLLYLRSKPIRSVSSDSTEQGRNDASARRVLTPPRTPEVVGGRDQVLQEVRRLRILLEDAEQRNRALSEQLEVESRARRKESKSASQLAEAAKAREADLERVVQELQEVQSESKGLRRKLLQSQEQVEKLSQSGGSQGPEADPPELRRDASETRRRLSSGASSDDLARKHASENDEMRRQLAAQSRELAELRLAASTRASVESECVELNRALQEAYRRIAEYQEQLEAASHSTTAGPDAPHTLSHELSIGDAAAADLSAARVSELEAKLAQTEAQLHHETEARASSEAELEGVYAAAAKLSADVDALRTQLATGQAETDGLRSALTAAETRATAAETTSASLQAELASAQARLAAADEDLAQLRQDRQRELAAHADAATSLQRDLADLRSRALDLEGQLRTQRDADESPRESNDLAVELESKAASFDDERRRWASERAALEDRVGGLEAEMAALSAGSERARAAVADVLQTQLELVQSECAQLRGQLEAAEVRAAAAETGAASLQADMSSAQSASTAANEVLAGLRQERERESAAHADSTASLERDLADLRSLVLDLEGQLRTHQAVADECRREASNLRVELELKVAAFSDDRLRWASERTALEKRISALEAENTALSDGLGVARAAASASADSLRRRIVGVFVQHLGSLSDQEALDDVDLVLRRLSDAGVPDLPDTSDLRPLPPDFPRDLALGDSGDADDARVVDAVDKIFTHTEHQAARLVSVLRGVDRFVATMSSTLPTPAPQPCARCRSLEAEVGALRAAAAGLVPAASSPSTPAEPSPPPAGVNRHLQQPAGDAIIGKPLRSGSPGVVPDSLFASVATTQPSKLSHSTPSAFNPPVVVLQTAAPLRASGPSAVATRAESPRPVAPLSSSMPLRSLVRSGPPVAQTLSQLAAAKPGSALKPAT